MKNESVDSVRENTAGEIILQTHINIIITTNI